MLTFKEEELEFHKSMFLDDYEVSLHGEKLRLEDYLDAKEEESVRDFAYRR